MTAHDLWSYKPIIARAVEGSYRGRKVYTTHAPTSGPVLLHILNILEAFDLVGEGRTGTNVHRFVEALKCELIPLRRSTVLELMYVFFSLPFGTVTWNSRFCWTVRLFGVVRCDVLISLPLSEPRLRTLRS